jgi:hypothetical protein
LLLVDGLPCWPDADNRPSLAEYLARPGDPADWPRRGLAPAAPGYDCDAAIVPVVTGHVDPAVLDRLARDWLSAGRGDAIATLPQPSPDEQGEMRQYPAESDDRLPSAPAMTALRDALLRYATDLLSGPAGLAAWLRADQVTGPAASVSLPLDIGAATDTIPAHLRRAVAVRDRGCRFPGCDQPPAACHPHHITRRADGGVTSQGNLVSLCSFHHLIAVHRWGWAVVLHGDGTVTATSPDGRRTLNGHGPPCRAA